MIDQESDILSTDATAETASKIRPIALRAQRPNFSAEQEQLKKLNEE